MRVLVVHHGPLPTDDAPTTGGAIRAATHVQALWAAGHEVRALGRAQDQAGGYRGPAHLRRLAEAFGPDWILCVAPSEAPALAPVAPLVVDLYAPRVLEAAFEGAQADEAGRAIRAIHAADELIFSNPRQRWHWSGALGLCGWDLRGEVGLVVPIAAHPRPRGEGPPLVIVGGHPWPWADASAAVERAVAHLAGRAEVQVWGLPAPAGARAMPLSTRGAWLEALGRATVLLDRYAPNLERELAVSFRQMDALGAGLPLITDPAVPLAAGVRQAGAGWVDESLESALDEALSAPRHMGAARLAERYLPERTEAPLLAWSPRRRPRERSAMATAAKLSAAQVRVEAERALREAAEAEVQRKRAEVDALVGQARALGSSVEALSAAMADVAGFRRETVQVLGSRLAGQTEEAEHLRRELEIARADLQKKEGELERLHAERDRLGNTIRKLLGRR